MAGEYPTKKQLQRIIKLHKQAFKFIPTNDALYGRMKRMLRDLEHRLETYEQFKVNPYSTHTSLPKYNSDTKLGLGDYTRENH